LIETEAGGCAEEGYLLVPTVHRLLASGDGLGASETAARAVEIGERFGDVDLAALGRNLQGWALLRQERLDAGLELIDESMLAATSGELSPIVTGLVYCTSISSCHEVYALGRVREWTAVLGSWCDAQPELVTFSGVCLAHRAEVLQLHGDWSGALEQARRVAERFAPGRDPEGSANAAYQTAEIQRLRGELELAEATYQRVAVLGREPQPGLALLRLRQGKREQAASGLRTALAGSSSPLQRARFLPALVEVLLELGDTPSAAAACAELEATALRYATEALTAFASATRARVELAQGEARSALARLRPAFGIWQRSSAPYLAARTRLLLAEACAALGDEEGARFELMAARAIFQELGAAPDVAHVDALCVPSEACRVQRAPERADAARAGSASCVGRGQNQPRHRPRARPEREDHRSSREQHLHEDCCVLARRSDGLRVPARAAVSRFGPFRADPRWPG
jgi:hypothetical protein